MIVVPTSLNKAFIKINDNQNLLGGSVEMEEKKLTDIQKDLERFEISYGQQSDSIIRYNYNRRRKHDTLENENDNNNLNNNNNNNNVKLNNNKNKSKHNNEELKKLYEMHDIDNNISEPFHGSLIIEQEEKILSIKSIVVAVLFLLVYHRFVFKNIIKIIKYNKWVSPLAIQALFFGVLFYLLEKYLLKY